LTINRTQWTYGTLRTIIDWFASSWRCISSRWTLESVRDSCGAEVASWTGYTASSASVWATSAERGSKPSCGAALGWWTREKFWSSLVTHGSCWTRQTSWLWTLSSVWIVAAERTWELSSEPSLCGAEISSRACDWLLVASWAITASRTDTASTGNYSLCSLPVSVHAWRTRNFVVKSCERAVLKTKMSSGASILILVIAGRGHEVAWCFLAILGTWTSNRVWITVISVTALFLREHRCIWIISWGNGCALICVWINILIDWTG